MWIDKPLACSTKEAIAIVEAAQRKNVPILSASSLRFDVTVQDVKNRREELGAVHGVDAFAPGSQHERNPGFFQCGHAVDLGPRDGTDAGACAAYAPEGPTWRWVSGCGRWNGARDERGGADRLHGGTEAGDHDRTSAYGYREMLKRCGHFESKEESLAGGELRAGRLQEAALIRWTGGERWT